MNTQMLMSSRLWPWLDPLLQDATPRQQEPAPPTMAVRNRMAANPGRLDPVTANPGGMPSRSMAAPATMAPLGRVDPHDTLTAPLTAAPRHGTPATLGRHGQALAGNGGTFTP